MVELGSGRFTYEVAEGWGKLPEGWGFKEVAAVGADARGMCTPSTGVNTR